MGPVDRAVLLGPGLGLLIVFGISLAGCGRNETSPPDLFPTTPTPTAIHTPTPRLPIEVTPSPTPTPIPQAAAEATVTTTVVPKATQTLKPSPIAPQLTPVLAEPTATPRPSATPNQNFSRRTPFVPLDNPQLITAQEAAFLSDDELVLGLEWQGEARAYPIQMITYHHIVNDTVGGRPILITY